MGSSFFVQIPLIAKEEKSKGPNGLVEESKLDMDKTSVNKYFDEDPKTNKINHFRK